MNWKCVSHIAFALAIISPVAHSQALTESTSRRFLSALCRNDSSVVELLDAGDLKTSERLGIQYEGVFAKLLCAQELDSATRSGIEVGRLDYRIKVDSLNATYQKLTMTVAGTARPYEFYFKLGKFVLASTYHSRNWGSFESEHFRFRFSDSSLVNSYAIERLEQFFIATAKMLEYSQEQLELMGREKIEYILCRDPREVEELTGYESRGMYELASDRVITCYNAHFHELVHLMVNFKLGTLPLRTHPFLQEGIAVAVGGRGGIERGVMTEMACFLVESGMANMDELLSAEGFTQSHSSISYPVCGLYSEFLLQEIGINSFFDLYRRNSTVQENIGGLLLNKGELPAESKWLAYVKKRGAQHAIELEPSDKDFKEIYSDSLIAISMGPSQYLIRTRAKAAFGGGDIRGNYHSTIFAQEFGEREYREEEFAIVANSDEIKIYNLYTNNLIANLVGSFRNPALTIPSENGVFSFVVNKSAFNTSFELEVTKGK